MRKSRPDEKSGDKVVLTGREMFQWEIIKVISDKLKSELLKTKETNSTVADRFSLFSNLSNTQPSVILELATKLQIFTFLI